jgi:hypothetical protein
MVSLFQFPNGRGMTLLDEKMFTFYYEHSSNSR